jgi:hypothetical protein
LLGEGACGGGGACGRGRGRSRLKAGALPAEAGARPAYQQAPLWGGRGFGCVWLWGGVFAAVAGGLRVRVCQLHLPQPANAPHAPAPHHPLTTPKVRAEITAMRVELATTRITRRAARLEALHEETAAVRAAMQVGGGPGRRADGGGGARGRWSRPPL